MKLGLFLLLVAAILLTAMLSACEDTSDVISLSLTIKNETEFEIQEIIFVVENDGQGQPYFYLTIVGSEDEPLSSGKKRQATISVSEKMLNSAWYAEIEASGAELRFDGTSMEIKKEVKGYIIFYAEETDFMFAPFYQ